MKKVLILSSEFPPQPGGIGNHAYHLAKYFALNGYEVQVLCDARSGNGREEKAFDVQQDFNIHRIKKRAFRGRMYLERIQRILRLIRQVDVCIASGKFSLWNVGFASLFHTCKTVAVLHGTEVNFKSVLLKQSITASLKRFDELVSVSNYTKSLVKHRFQSVSVIPNGIEVNSWRTNGSSISGEVDKIKGPHLVTVGRISERKGQWQVIEHLPKLLERYPGLQYHCIGLDQGREGLGLRAEVLGVTEQVRFYGAVTRERLLELLSQMDVFVMLSGASKTGDVEGFGIAILEANALGLPAIGAKGSGVEDAIKDGFSGRLVAKEDADAFLNALTELREHKENYQTKAREWAREHDWKHIIKEYIQLIE